MAKKKQRGLGKGLDSLIPDFYNEEFDSNNSISLEDMLNEDKENDIDEINSKSENEETTKEEKNLKSNKEKTPSNDDEIKTKIDKKETISEEKNKEDPKESSDENINDIEKEIDIEEKSEDIAKIDNNIDKNLTEREIKNIEEVKEIVSKNPRITLWSSHSAAVFRYLRKTEPEFSISKEGSILIDEAVSKKYPEIWKLFKEI